MELCIINWNIGGAKFLEQKKRAKRDDVRKELNSALQKLISDHQPDVVTLQEIVRYQEPSKDNSEIDLIDAIDGYKYYPIPLINSLLFSSQAKWNKVKDGSDWDPNTYFAQGNAMLFREDAPLFPVWDLSNLKEKSPGRQRLNFQTQFSGDDGREFQDKKYLIEHVHLDTGLYFGDRDTEPRAALVAHLIYDPLEDKTRKLENSSAADPRPLDIFIVNVHLVTIIKERVGIPNVDARAARMRQSQLDIIFDGIVSRYNTWADDKYPQRGQTRTPEGWESFNRRKPVWILCGDFNFTEESDEYNFIKRRNFIDTTPPNGRIAPQGTGTKAKGAGNPPTLTLDYIFAGPKFIAFDPVFEERGITRNIVDHDVKVSDHYPVISKLPLVLLHQ